MRPSLSLLLITLWPLWTMVPVAQAQTVVSRPAEKPSEAAGGPSAEHPRARRATGAARRSGAAGKADGVLALGATDITGNKELPKVMVIVPWKGSLGAGGVVKPTDSLLDEALEPVDRDVFRRQIHYYGQLKAKGKPSAVGDSR
jgi:hypothetical protein